MLPLTNSTAPNLPGERWKDIPGFEGIYQLSNYGRTRSVKPRQYLADTTIKRRPILKPHISFRHNPQTGNKEVATVQVELYREGKGRAISVARWVYCLFVKKFNLRSKTLVITHKDGNKLNCHYKNLHLVSQRDLIKEGFLNGSRKSNFKHNIKPVTQYDSSGRLLAAFPSTKIAAAQTGVSLHSIHGAALKKTRKSGGFYWRYGKGKRIKVKRRHTE